MSCKLGVPNQLLEIVGHANQIPLDYTVLEVKTGRVQITRDELAVMHVFDTIDHHTEDRDGLLEVKVLLTEGLPGELVVRRLCCKLDQALLGVRRG